jgi:Leucine-rich repeat (LRR) protein
MSKMNFIYNGTGSNGMNVPQLRMNIEWLRRRINFPLYLCVFVMSVTFILPWRVVAQHKKISGKERLKKINAERKQINSKKDSSATQTFTKEEIEEYKTKISRLISFLEFALNTVGSDSSETQDKEIITNKSYLKFFKDSKVQIEDDLDEDRKVINYKNVQAYLQDVDYFFKHAKFDLNVESIEPFLSDKAQPYFIVTLTRFLNGYTIDGDTIRNNKKRYVEVNLNLKDKDLKIASIYSTKYDEGKDLKDWWSSLPGEWQTIFRKFAGADSMNLAHLKRLLNTESIEISGNKDITSIEPLNRLVKLKVVNISDTRVEDLTPLRNLIYLEILNCAKTPVKTLSPLKYANELKEINLNRTGIKDLEPLKICHKLEKIDFSETAINNVSPLAELTGINFISAAFAPLTDIKPLNNLKSLLTLNLSATLINTITTISEFEKLTYLDISNTRVKDLTPLSNLRNLKILMINNTEVNSLENLKNLPIERIYCDHSLVNRHDIIEFMSSRPGTLVIYESEGILKWWNDLNEDWRKIFRQYLVIDNQPTKEQLASLANLPEVDLSGNKNINSLSPLSSISNLRILKLNNTTVDSLGPIRDLLNLEVLDISNTPVHTLESIMNLKNLKYLNIENTKIENAQRISFNQQHPDCLILYKSTYLYNWWSGVPDEWRQEFRKHLTLAEPATEVQLHQLVKRDTIIVKDNSRIKDLNPIAEFHEIRHLEFTNTAVSDLTPIENIKTLKTLKFFKNPIKDLNPIKSMTELTSLDFENTGVSDLEPLKELKSLEYIKCSGTPVKDLKYLAHHENLTFLDCSSTGINNLKPLEKLQKITILKCYNTRLTSSKVDKFKKSHPSCEVIYY